MFKVVRFRDGTCRIFSDKTEELKGNYEVLGSYAELEKAEQYLAEIREFMILKREDDGKKFVILSRQRKDYPQSTIEVALTTSDRAKEVLNEMNKK